MLNWQQIQSKLSRRLVYFELQLILTIMVTNGLILILLHVQVTIVQVFYLESHHPSYLSGMCRKLTTTWHNSLMACYWYCINLEPSSYLIQDHRINCSLSMQKVQMLKQETKISNILLYRQLKAWQFKPYLCLGPQ